VLGNYEIVSWQNFILLDMPF